MLYSDILSKIHFYTKTNSTSFTDADVVIGINNKQERVESIILQSDGRWQFDDVNQTDLPIATTSLVTDQQDYSLPSTDIEITRIEVLDQTSNWTKLIPIDQADLYQQSLTDYLKTSGLPIYYDKLGNSLFLYPKPSFTQSASLKVWFKRAPVAITSASLTATSLTAQPGFNSMFHELIPLWVSYDYGIANGLTNVGLLMTEIQRLEQSIQDAYSLRDKDEHLSLRARKPSVGWNWFR